MKSNVKESKEALVDGHMLDHVRPLSLQAAERFRNGCRQYATRNRETLVHVREGTSPLAIDPILSYLFRGRKRGIKIDRKGGKPLTNGLQTKWTRNGGSRLPPDSQF